jgi:hypothetical protein
MQDFRHFSIVNAALWAGITIVASINLNPILNVLILHPLRIKVVSLPGERFFVSIHL